MEFTLISDDEDSAQDLVFLLVISVECLLSFVIDMHCDGIRWTPSVCNILMTNPACRIGHKW